MDREDNKVFYMAEIINETLHGIFLVNHANPDKILFLRSYYEAIVSSQLKKKHVFT